MAAPMIQFRAKVQDFIYAGHDAPEYRYVDVPALKRSHYDMSAFRTHPRFGSYANSDLFPSMLKRAVPYKRIRLDQIPEGVTVDTSGFLALVTITL